MTQPEWKYKGNLGDANPLEHGGMFVFEDTTGKYDPEMEVLTEPECEGGTYEVHRFSMTRCTWENGVLSDNPFHKDHPAWFASDIEDVARSCGYPAEDLIDCLTSDNIMARADGYRDLIGHWGCGEFDQYPLTLTEEEANVRYANIGFGKLPVKHQVIRTLIRNVQNRIDQLENSESSDSYTVAYMRGELSALRGMIRELEYFDDHSI